MKNYVIANYHYFIINASVEASEEIKVFNNKEEWSSEIYNNILTEEDDTNSIDAIDHCIDSAIVVSIVDDMLKIEFDIGHRIITQYEENYNTIEEFISNFEL